MHPISRSVSYPRMWCLFVQDTPVVGPVAFDFFSAVSQCLTVSFFQHVSATLEARREYTSEQGGISPKSFALGPEVPRDPRAEEERQLFASSPEPGLSPSLQASGESQKLFLFYCAGVILRIFKRCSWSAGVDCDTYCGEALYTRYSRYYIS